MKVSLPLLTDEELLEVDKNWQYLVDKYMMMTLKEKDQLIAQYVMKKQKEETERLNNIIVKLKKVLWQRSEEARKNEQYIRLNCYKDILNELVNTIYEVDDETNE